MASLKLSPSFDGFSYLINIHKLPRKTSIKVLKSDEYPPFTPRQAIMLAQLLSVALTACVKATDTKSVSSFNHFLAILTIEKTILDTCDI